MIALAATMAGEEPIGTVMPPPAAHFQDQPFLGHVSD
jgi:hypothetical protein